MSPGTLRRADRQADRRYARRQARESFGAGSPPAPLHHPGRGLLPRRRRGVTDASPGLSFRTTLFRVVGVVPRTLDRNQVLAVAGASTGHIENLTPDQVKLDAARTLVRRPTVGRGRRVRRSPVGDVRHRAVRASHHLGGEPTARERRGRLWADATAVRLERLPDS